MYVNAQVQLKHLQNQTNSNVWIPFIENNLYLHGNTLEEDLERYTYFLGGRGYPLGSDFAEHVKAYFGSEELDCLLPNQPLPHILG